MMVGIFEHYYNRLSQIVSQNSGYLFGHDFFRQLLLVDSIRYLVVLIRYIFFTEVLKQLKTYKTDSPYIRNDINGNQNTAEYNLTGLHDMSVARSLRLIKPLSVIETYRPLSATERPWGMLSDLNHLCDAKVLCIGPRTEGELFCLVAHGFQHSNIRGLDLISYSPWVDLGDMHAMPYADNTWDIVTLSMTLTYSEVPQKVAEEVVRVLKSGGLVAISLDNNPESEKSTIQKYGYPLASADSILKLFDDFLDRVYFSHDRTEVKDSQTYTASVIFSIKKQLNNFNQKRSELLEESKCKTITTCQQFTVF